MFNPATHSKCVPVLSQEPMSEFVLVYYTCICIYVYFGAGSSLGCPGFCIDRSACFHTLYGAIHRLSYRVGYGSLLKAVWQSLYVTFKYLGVWCLVGIYSISLHFIKYVPLISYILPSADSSLSDWWFLVFSSITW